MTRLAFDLDALGGPKLQRRRAAHRGRRSSRRSATFQNARLWDYRPLQTTLDQLQTVRQYYDFYDVDMDRYSIDGETRQVMLSRPRAGPRAQPAGRDLGQPADRLHPRLRARDGPGQRGGRAGPAPAHHPRHAARSRRRGAAGDPAADLLRRAAQRLGRRRGPAGRVRLPDRERRRDRRRAASQDETRWTGDTGIRLDSILSRLLFAARFRDLNLLISDQVTADSQLLMHRSLGERLEPDRAVPGLRQGPLLGGQRRGPPRLRSRTPTR